MLREARDSLPELPAARIARYEAELGLDEAQARLLAGDPSRPSTSSGRSTAVDDAEPRVVANWVTGDLTAALRAADRARRRAAGSKVPAPPSPT